LKIKLEHVLCRLIYRFDMDIREVHYEYLSNQLLKLFLSHQKKTDQNTHKV